MFISFVSKLVKLFQLAAQNVHSGQIIVFFLSFIFVCGCATLGLRTLPFDKVHQGQNFDPVSRQILQKVRQMWKSFMFEVDEKCFLVVKFKFSAPKPFCKTQKVLK